MTEYDPVQLKFVIDDETETKCNFGEYYDHDGTITINLLHMDDQSTLISTIIHEVMHKVIVEESGERTTSEQDHFIIPRLMS